MKLLCIHRQFIDNLINNFILAFMTCIVQSRVSRLNEHIVFTFSYKYLINASRSDAVDEHNGAYVQPLLVFVNNSLSVFRAMLRSIMKYSSASRRDTELRDKT